MKRIRHIFLAVLVTISMLPLSGCSKSTDADDDGCVRIGAVCNDGTRSDATGRGACSHHGGVKYWICQ